ncbi:MAG TPA: hypothetical protein VHC86_11985, partial [Opitutaceae bacterium]|nr:hypothetical protein [Opitutaceae bacterium]
APRPRLGRLVAERARPGPAAAARFGARTFLDSLEADSPAEALRIARQAWERHEKARAKEDGARSKEETRAEKAAAKGAPKGRRKAE